MKKEHIAGRTSAIDIDGTCTGIYHLTENEIVMIDSGRTYSPELFAWLNRNRLRVKAIIHTHLHIDHIGNTYELVTKYGAEAFASDTEIRLMDYHYSDTLPDVTANADGGPVRIVYHEEESAASGDGENTALYGDGKNRAHSTQKEAVFQTVFTPGHSIGHQMVITPDDVCFLGDAIMSEKILRASKMPFHMDTIESLNSIEIIRNTDYRVYVASHFGIIKKHKLAEVLDKNAAKELKLYETLRMTAKDAMTVDELADRFMKNAGVDNPDVRNLFWMQESSRRRIEEMLEIGMLVKEDGLIHRG